MAEWAIRPAPSAFKASMWKHFGFCEEERKNFGNTRKHEAACYMFRAKEGPKTPSCVCSKPEDLHSNSERTKQITNSKRQLLMPRICVHLCCALWSRDTMFHLEDVWLKLWLPHHTETKVTESLKKASRAALTFDCVPECDRILCHHKGIKK